MSARDTVPPFPPVAELVPQRPPMLLLDDVAAASGVTITCTAVVREGNPLARDGRVHASAVLEYMAQTIAALAGLRARASGHPPAIGLIAACRDLDLAVEHLRVGDRLQIDAERVWPPAADASETSPKGAGEPVLQGASEPVLQGASETSPKGAGELVGYRARVTRDGALLAAAEIHVVSARRSP